MKVDPHKGIYQSVKTMREIEPTARIVKLWKGDNWPDMPIRVHVSFDLPELCIYGEEGNKGAESFVEFDNGYLIAVRTDEQARGNPPPIFGRARKAVGNTDKRTDRKAKRGK